MYFIYCSVTGGGISGRQLKMIAENVAARLQPALECVVEQRGETILTERGKYKMVIQNCKL